VGGGGNNRGGAVGNYQKTEPGNQWKTTTIDGVARNIASLLLATRRITQKLVYFNYML
jgi:hypothetical protein